MSSAGRIDFKSVQDEEKIKLMQELNEAAEREISMLQERQPVMIPSANVLELVSRIKALGFQPIPEQQPDRKRKRDPQVITSSQLAEQIKPIPIKTKRVRDEVDDSDVQKKLRFSNLNLDETL